MSSALEVLAVKALAKKRGIPEAQAETIIEAMKNDYGTETFQRWVSTIALNAETLAKLPPDLRQNMSVVAAQTLAGGGGSGSAIDDFGAKIAVIKEAFRDDTRPPSTDPELRQKIEGLQQLVQEMKDEKTKKEWEEMVGGLQERLDKMQEQMTNQSQPKESEDSIDKLAKDAESIQNRFGKLRELLGIKETAPSTPLDSEGMKKELLSRGYKVEGPKTIEEVEKALRKEWAERETKIKEETLKAVKSDEKKMSMIVDLGTSLIESVIPVLGKGGGAKGLEIASKALQTAKEGV